MAEIKIRELSIGDWVRVDDFDKVLIKRVSAIDGTRNQIGIIKNNRSGIYWYYNDEIEPIPLTLEILEKNGFEIIDESADFQLYGSPECSIFFTKGTVRYRLETPQASVVCWNVHQLQHALRLAGVEKEIEV